MRGLLYATTALITRDGPLVPPARDAKVVPLEGPPATVPNATPAAGSGAGGTSFSDHCLCSDGEIFLKDEDHLKLLLQRPG